MAKTKKYVQAKNFRKRKEHDSDWNSQFQVKLKSFVSDKEELIAVIGIFLLMLFFVVLNWIFP